MSHVHQGTSLTAADVTGACCRRVGPTAESDGLRPGRSERHRSLERSGPHVARDLDWTAQRQRIDGRLCRLFNDSADHDGQVCRTVKHQDPVVGWLVVVGGPGLGAFRPIYEGNNTVGRGKSQ